MSEWAEWVEILWGFTKFYLEQMLKVSAFYLEKQKKIISKKSIFQAIVSKYAKIAVLIFSEGFATYYVCIR